MASACFSESLVRQVSWFVSEHKKKSPQTGIPVDKIVSLSGPAAAESLESLASEFDKERGKGGRGRGESQYGGSTYDDDCTDNNSVLSSSNMHEAQPNSPSGNRPSCSTSPSYTHFQSSGRSSSSGNTDNCRSMQSTDSTYLSSFAELAHLESDPVSPYRLVSTFEVHLDFLFLCYGSRYHPLKSGWTYSYASLSSLHDPHPFHYLHIPGNEEVSPSDHVPSVLPPLYRKESVCEAS